MSEASKTIAITGGRGFVGRHVVDHLLRKNYVVRVLERPGSMKNATGGEKTGSNVEIRGERGEEATQAKRLNPTQVTHDTKVIAGDLFNKEHWGNLCLMRKL